MLRVVFFLSAAFYLLLGAVLYFLPAAGMAGLIVTPLWVARFAGAVVVAWGVFALLGAGAPTGPATVGLVVANLLVSATLVPAALSGDTAVTGLPQVLPLTASAFLTVLALLAIVSPRPRHRF